MTEHSSSGSFFKSQKFSDFPSVKEALVSDKIQATFMVAPLAMKLVSDGMPVKIVYLGHRDGTALVVGKDSAIRDFGDLRGTKIAIPSRFSNQNLLMHRMMARYGLEEGEIELLEMPPPDMSGALAAEAIDGYIVGEPHCAKSELGGWGRVLYLTKDIWPGFISCVLVVRQDQIDQKPELVQELVDGIAASGKWLDEGENGGYAHRMEAAVVAGRYYYNQDPALLKFVLSRPMDRVRYTDLKPLRANFEEIMTLAVETCILSRRLEFEEYVDDRFAPDTFALQVPFEHLLSGPALEEALSVPPPEAPR